MATQFNYGIAIFQIFCLLLRCQFNSKCGANSFVSSLIKSVVDNVERINFSKAGRKISVIRIIVVSHV